MALTIEQLAYWQGYIDTLKPIMRLNDWRITLDGEPCNDDADASTWMSKDYQSATMYLSATFDEQSVHDQRDTIAHELIHIHLTHMSQFADQIADQLGAQASGLAKEMSKHFLERATDELARVISPFLPLPPGGKE